jgi:hypothetical protein
MQKKVDVITLAALLACTTFWMRIPEGTPLKSLIASSNARTSMTPEFEESPLQSGPRNRQQQERKFKRM